jgi:hypothetical protein
MASDIIITFDFEGSKSSQKKVVDQAEKTGKKAGKQGGEKFSVAFSQQTKKSLIGTKAIIASVGASIVAAFSAKKIIDAAKVQESAISSMNAQLRLLGSFSEETSRDLQNFASSLQEVTTFGDEAIISQLAFSQAMGATVEQSKEILTAATDMSAALNIDLNSAVRNISKTLGGYAGELGEVIPELKNLTQEQLQAGDGIALLASKFTGSAFAATKTFAGSTTQLSNTFGDLLEKLGDLIIKNPKIIATVNALNTIFKDLQGAVTDNNASMKNFVGEGVVLAVEGFGALAIGAIELGKQFLYVRGFINDLDASFTKFVDETVQGTVSLLASLPLVGDKFKELNEGMIQSNAEKNREIAAQEEMAMLNRIDNLSQIQETINGSLEMVRNAVTASNAIVAEGESPVVEKAKADAVTLANVWKGVKGNFKATAKSMQKTSVDLAKTVSTALINGLGTGVSSAFSAFGAALVKGENAMAAFGKAILGVIGDVAINLGNSFIAQGIAHSLNPLTPGAGAGLIGAGAALSLLGGAIKALGSGGVGATSQPTGGGVAAAPTTEAVGGETVAAAEPEVLEERVAGTAVNVNIQGDVLDSEQTGLRIVDMLNDAFDKQGVVLSNNAGFA